MYWYVLICFELICRNYIEIIYCRFRRFRGRVCYDGKARVDVQRGNGLSYPRRVGKRYSRHQSCCMLLNVSIRGRSGIPSTLLLSSRSRQSLFTGRCSSRWMNARLPHGNYKSPSPLDRRGRLVYMHAWLWTRERQAWAFAGTVTHLSMSQVALSAVERLAGALAGRLPE